MANDNLKAHWPQCPCVRCRATPLLCADCGRVANAPAIDLAARAFCAHCARLHSMWAMEHNPIRSYEEWQHCARERQETA